MIHWNEAGLGHTDAERARWRRRVCHWEIAKDGSCRGVAQGSYGNDEPHDVCKACDRNEFGWKLVSAE